tara:strand:+ start:6914 stop:7741 length:828 start_codon:yes stop_codon:yes gene_type:complete
MNTAAQRRDTADTGSVIYSEEISCSHGAEAPVVLLIHGLAGTCGLWNPVSQVLREHFRVIRYDLRGHGESGSPEGPWTLEDFVADLLQVLRRHDLSRIHLAGFSLGGLVAQRFAIDHPDKLERLAIVSAVAGRTVEEKEKVARRLENLRSGDFDSNVEAALERWFSPDFRERHPDVVEQRMALMRKVGCQRGYLQAYEVFSTSDLADELHRISTPTLIMTGEEDPGSNPRMATLMHSRIRGSRMEILSGLRHSLLVEAPELVAEKLNEFFLEKTD